MADFGGRTVLDPHIDPDQAQAAAATLQRVATRLGAPQADLDTALAALLAEPTSGQLLAPHHLKAGTPASPADKARIRELIAAGLENAAIANEVGCSVQNVNGVRSADLMNARRRTARQAAEA